jgi:hypothetical protein
MPIAIKFCIFEEKVQIGSFLQRQKLAAINFGGIVFFWCFGGGLKV